VTHTLKSIVEKAEENEINVASEILFDRFGLDWVLMSGDSVAKVYALQSIPVLDEHVLDELSSKYLEENKECVYGVDRESYYVVRYSQPNSVALRKLMWSLERFARYSILCRQQSWRERDRDSENRNQPISLCLASGIDKNG
jgi:hypothetical protein